MILVVVVVQMFMLDFHWVFTSTPRVSKMTCQQLGIRVMSFIHVSGHAAVQCFQASF